MPSEIDKFYAGLLNRGRNAMAFMLRSIALIHLGRMKVTTLLEPDAPEDSASEPSGTQRRRITWLSVILVALVAVVAIVGLFAIRGTDSGEASVSAEGSETNEPDGPEVAQSQSAAAAVSASGRFEAGYLPEGVSATSELITRPDRVNPESTVTEQDFASADRSVVFSVTSVSPTDVETSFETLQRDTNAEPTTVRGKPGFEYQAGEGSPAVAWAESEDRTVFVVGQGAAPDELMAVVDGLKGAGQ